MIWYYYYVYYGAFEMSDFYYTSYNFFLGLAKVSPVLRKCYNFSEENESQWVFLAERLFTFENLWRAVKGNLMSSYT